MKKIRIPFSLDEYNKGIYEVETRGDGKSKPKKARILCIDLNNVLGRSIVAAFCLIDEQEIINTFYPDGKYRASYCGDELDLYLTKQEFEDGDIISDNKGNIAIFKNYTKENQFSFYVGLFCSVKLYFDNDDIIDNCHLATEEEKQKLFVALEKEGKRWNAETKQVEDITHKCTLQPFDKVIVRIVDSSIWCCGIFSHFNTIRRTFVCTGEINYDECVPFNDETKYLLGTTEDAPEKCKTW